jgi:hypothetical protein
MQIGDERVVRERQVKMCCSLVNKAQWRKERRHRFTRPGIPQIMPSRDHKVGEENSVIRKCIFASAPKPERHY